jgi:chloramphenicol-sensitive protein RarD
VSLTVEVFLLLPLCVGYLVFLYVAGGAKFLAAGTGIDTLLILGGLITVIPLVCFGQAARKLPLSTLGFVQYIAPTAQFLVAVLVFREMTFRESADWVRLSSFVLIWLSLAIYSVDSVVAYRRRHSAGAADEECRLPATGTLCRNGDSVS